MNVSTIIYSKVLSTIIDFPLYQRQSARGDIQPVRTSSDKLVAATATHPSVLSSYLATFLRAGACAVGMHNTKVHAWKAGSICGRPTREASVHVRGEQEVRICETQHWSLPITFNNGCFIVRIGVFDCCFLFFYSCKEDYFY